MKAPLKRAVTIYSSWELFLMQHPKRLQLLHLGCQEKRYFYGCSSKSWHGGKLRKLLDVSFDSPHVSPCIHVPGLHVPCAFFSIPADSRARAPCPTPSISGADEVGGKHWLGKPFVYTSGGWRGSVSIFCSGAQPPPLPPPPKLCLGSYFHSDWLLWTGLHYRSALFAGIQHWLCLNVSNRPLDSIFLAGVSGPEESLIEFSFCLSL